MRSTSFIAACIAVGLVGCGVQEDSNPAEASAPLIETSDLRPASDDTELEAAAEATADALQSLGDDFAVLELAARTQTAFQLRDNGAEVELRAIAPDGRVAVEETFVLLATEPAQSAMLDTQAREGHAIRRFELDPADTARMRDVRRTLAELKASAPGQNQLGLNAVVHGCLAEGHEAPDALNLAIYLKTRPDEDFFPFVQEQALTMDDTPFAEQFWTPCSTGS